MPEIVHDETGGRVMVPADAVSVYARSGWRQVGQPAEDAAAAPRPEPWADGEPGVLDQVDIYHPGLARAIKVPALSVHHYRLGGWVTVEEWEAAQQAEAEAATKAARASKDKHAGAEPAKGKTEES
jgi:hypothetical protein